jgi:hypothetical protein
MANSTDFPRRTLLIRAAAAGGDVREHYIQWKILTKSGNGHFFSRALCFAVTNCTEKAKRVWSE